MSESSAGDWNPGRFVAAAVGMAAVGAIGLFAIGVWAIVFAAIGASVLGVPELGVGGQQIASSFGVGGGTLMVTAGYVAWTDRTWGFVDLARPTLRDGLYAVGGLLALLGVVAAISTIASYFDVAVASHVISEAAADDPSILLPLIPLSILVVGPGEELLYRNVVQKHLYAHAPRWAAIVAASVVFAGVHILAYSGNDTVGAVAVTLASIFVLSLVLGVVYARTENVLVPAVVHGAYNAYTFASEYVELVGLLAL
jgi:membrane protease YdiL (CAAX protease family)